MAVATKPKATKPTAQKPEVQAPEAAAPAIQFTPDQMAGIARYNEAYLAEVQAAANIGPIDGQRLVQAHYRARTALRSVIVVADATCPTCGGTKVAI